MNFDEDMEYAQKMKDLVTDIVKKLAGDIVNVTVSTPEEDMKFATDYKITVKAGDIACRVRRPGTWEQFGDVTIRASRPYADKTELQKLKEGFADWYFYAWESEKGGFEKWIFFDLNKLRESNFFKEMGGRQRIRNTDGSATFVTVDLDEIRKHNAMVDEGKYETGDKNL